MISDIFFFSKFSRNYRTVQFSDFEFFDPFQKNIRNCKCMYTYTVYMYGNQKEK